MLFYMLADLCGFLRPVIFNPLPLQITEFEHCFPDRGGTRGEATFTGSKKTDALLQKPENLLLHRTQGRTCLYSFMHK